VTIVRIAPALCLQHGALRDLALGYIAPDCNQQLAGDCAGTQRGHIRSCRRFAAFLNRSPDTATTEDIRRFQLHLAEADVSICNRNRIMCTIAFRMV
jgi:integrase-like protein